MGSVQDSICRFQRRDGCISALKLIRRSAGQALCQQIHVCLRGLIGSCHPRIAHAGPRNATYSPGRPLTARQRGGDQPWLALALPCLGQGVSLRGSGRRRSAYAGNERGGLSSFFSRGWPAMSSPGGGVFGSQRPVHTCKWQRLTLSACLSHSSSLAATNFDKHHIRRSRPEFGRFRESCLCLFLQVSVDASIASAPHSVS